MKFNMRELFSEKNWLMSLGAIVTLLSCIPFYFGRFLPVGLSGIVVGMSLFVAVLGVVIFLSGIGYRVGYKEGKKSKVKGD